MSEQEGPHLIIAMQSRPAGFGLCYECKDGRHEHCIGVPCGCSCAPVPAASSEPTTPPLAVVAYELWLELDKQRSRDARVMSPALRRLQERLGKALQDSLTEEERTEILRGLKRGAEDA